VNVPEADFKHMNLKLSEQYGGREPFIPGITKKIHIFAPKYEKANPL